MTILEQALSMQKYISDYHHDIHMHPELGFHEFRTMEKLKAELEDLGLSYVEYDPTGLHVDIHGELPDNGCVVGLRADLDALPVLEVPEAEYRSVYEGKMHACGHDANQSMLLAAVHILNSRRKEFAGTVRCLFQPAEELGQGGKFVLSQGVCEGVNAFYGMHVAVETELNAIGYQYGKMGSAVAEFEILVEGHTAPGSQPEKGIDACVTACEIVSVLQSIVSRRVPAQDALVLTVSYIKAGEDNVNFTPGSARIRGNCRWLDDSLNDRLESWIREIAENVGRAHGTNVEVKYDFLIPPLVCDPTAAEIAKNSAIEVMGANANLFVFGPIMASEDFSWLSHEVPGAYLEIGCGLDSGGTHSDTFHVNDECLPYGVAIYVTTALNALKFYSSNQKEN